MIRKAIVPVGSLFSIAVICVCVIGVETMFGLAVEDSSVTVPRTACAAGALDASVNTLTLHLSCYGGRTATTTSPATIKAYAAAPTAPLSCKLFKSGRAECDVPKGAR